MLSAAMLFRLSVRTSFLYFKPCRSSSIRSKILVTVFHRNTNSQARTFGFYAAKRVWSFHFIRVFEISAAKTETMVFGTTQNYKLPDLSTTKNSLFVFVAFLRRFLSCVDLFAISMITWLGVGVINTLEEFLKRLSLVLYIVLLWVFSSEIWV